MTKIKICGLTRLEDIEAVNLCLPDYIGFVFAKSKRKISRGTAKRLKERLNPAIKTAGVFVNEEMEEIISLCNENIIDLIQLHGEEDNEYIETLHKQVTCKIIKAVRVQGISKIETAADYLLLDTYHPTQYGGTGETFDWDIFRSINTMVEKPCFLAGGINTGNIEEAVRSGAPYCIDVSSGVESAGLKDPMKIREIVEKVRRV